ncbi:class I SAM-dependent methyltransferase [Megalodesulfovibrio paquesii]
MSRFVPFRSVLGAVKRAALHALLRRAPQALLIQHTSSESLIDKIRTSPESIHALLAILSEPEQASAHQELDTFLTSERGRGMIRRLLPALAEELIETLTNTHTAEVIEVLLRNHKAETMMALRNQLSGTPAALSDMRLRVILGAGTHRHPGWIATDADSLDIVSQASWERLFLPDSIDNLLAEHVFEHLNYGECLTAFQLAHRFLKLGGVLRIAVPDAYHPSRYYYNQVKPGGKETPDEHKLFFDYELVTELAATSGFRIDLIEYFDENGQFHKKPFSEEAGMILRRADANVGFDLSDPDVRAQFYNSIPAHLRDELLQRNIGYTSLLFDLIK